MPRTTITKTVAPYPNPTAGVAVTETAADVTNLNQIALTGNEILIARNSGGVTYTVTVTSVADPYGRTGHISAENITAGQIRVYGPFDLTGWKQTDGMLYFQANNAAVLFSVIQVKP